MFDKKTINDIQIERRVNKTRMVQILDITMSMIHKTNEKDIKRRTH